MSVPPTNTNKARIWRGPIPGTHEPGFKEHTIVELPLSEDMRRQVHGPENLELHWFKMGECTILLGYEPGGVHREMRWHLTISHPDRHPTWDEIKTARYRLLGPDTVMAMILPQAQFYVNLPAQDHVFQLWEIEDEAFVWIV